MATMLFYNGNCSRHGLHVTSAAETGPSMDKHTPYYELLEAIRDAGCPICRLAVRSGDRFLETYSYEHVNDIEIRELVRLAKGFCHNHTWRLFHKHSPLGTALTFYDILGEAAHQIGAARERQGLLSSLAGRVRKRLAPEGTCLGCDAQSNAEQRHLGLLVESLRNEREAQEAYGSADGLCLHHLRAALRARPSREATDILLRVQEQRIAAVREQMSEIVRKADYRVKERVTQADIDSLPAALAQVVGQEALD